MAVSVFWIFGDYMDNLFRVFNAQLGHKLLWSDHWRKPPNLHENGHTDGRNNRVSKVVFILHDTGRTTGENLQVYIQVVAPLEKTSRYMTMVLSHPEVSSTGATTEVSSGDGAVVETGGFFCQSDHKVTSRVRLICVLPGGFLHETTTGRLKYFFGCLHCWSVWRVSRFLKWNFFRLVWWRVKWKCNTFHTQCSVPKSNGTI